MDGLVLHGENWKPAHSPEAWPSLLSSMKEAIVSLEARGSFQSRSAVRAADALSESSDVAEARGLRLLTTFALCFISPCALCLSTATLRQ